MKTSLRTVRVRTTAPLAVADLTDDLFLAVTDSRITDGSAIAFCAHTTCTLLINEDEEGALLDLTARLTTLIPTEIEYAHDDVARRGRGSGEAHERKNGHAHVAQMIMGGTSHAIPIQGGRPMLGRWQRLLLLELDEPRDRNVLFHVFGE